MAGCFKNLPCDALAQINAVPFLDDRINTKGIVFNGLWQCIDLRFCLHQLSNAKINQLEFFEQLCFTEYFSADGACQEFYMRPIAMKMRHRPDVIRRGMGQDNILYRLWIDRQ